MTEVIERKVPLGAVERELLRQMKELQGPDERPVQRTRMANLVVYCTSEERAARVNTEIPEVVSVHPARVILLIADAESACTELEASVLVRPLRVGSHGFGFSEQVTLRAGRDAVHHLPFAVRALLIGDLPTNLWWAAPVPPPLAGPILYELAEHAQQIVYDSMGWQDPARGVAATAGWLQQMERADGPGRWRVASDVNWRRLKYWRRILIQSLEGAEDRGLFESADEIRVEHGRHAVVQAWMLMSWLTGQLGWKVGSGRVEPGVEMTWRFHGPTGEPLVRIHRNDDGPPELQRIRIGCCIDGRESALDLSEQEGQRLTMRVEGMEEAPRTMTVPAHAPAELVGRQLSDRERDPVFRASMGAAQVMARSLLE
ncbi:MAG TPA: glucose-6-phosphate dehydrogenase assembly protein OpcA [Gemmataceae bacterium]|nr:glucose-6-phosphate dehydrogenase assembly protein OpcA [Gemmataceae bacterium]